MKKNFEKYAYTDFLKNGEVTINNEPSMFFWGDKSRRDLSFVEQQLDLSKAFSPTIAYKVRSMLAAFLHDAIWVQKNHHMLTVIDELNEQVKAENARGNKVVLFGYSAGSFITMEYLFNKMPYINLAEYFEKVKSLALDYEYDEAAKAAKTCEARPQRWSIRRCRWIRRSSDRRSARRK